MAITRSEFLKGASAALMTSGCLIPDDKTHPRYALQLFSIHKIFWSSPEKMLTALKHGGYDGVEFYDQIRRENRLGYDLQRNITSSPATDRYGKYISYRLRSYRDTEKVSWTPLFHSCQGERSHSKRHFRSPADRWRQVCSLARSDSMYAK